MKKFGLILVGCLAFTGFCGAHANDIGDAARAATRRDSGTIGALRQHFDTMYPNTTTRTSGGRSATTINRSATTTRGTRVVNRSSEQGLIAPTSVVARTAGSARPGTTKQPSTSTRTTTQTRYVSNARTAATPIISRAATQTSTRENILTRNYSKCKSVFNECMDEFCANKDAQLKRCACSARANEFDRIKRQLENIDEKMLDFNQRLLAVSMNEKDVAALNIATEGEKAFYDTKDTSESKRTLDAIAKKLNTSFDKSNFTSGIGNVLTWSLDADSVFDSIDYLQGVPTAAKSGTSLYSAALPICREMAAEVCSDEDLSIVETGYQVLIEQDCNTIEKTYKTAVQQARTKVLESSALLDISRLNVYQTNNADDILTCKKKMLAMLTDSTICGENMGKCLDITGQYIDPSTGDAFLSADLIELGNLITRPDETHTWTNAPGNAVFVSFINSKKQFLEPAMEHCQSISDVVWDAFVEDALSQIKIAQMRKLEDVRQSCTTLTAQCLSDAADSITNFDARALSTFGVLANVTNNAMCEKILSSCTSLLNTTDTDQEWVAGMSGIQTDITYETIKQTCREVGRACIIQVCTSTSGNFGLCENIDTSINRKSIVNRTACWNEVMECVANAGTDAIKQIFVQNGLESKDAANNYQYITYSQMYGITNPIINQSSNESCAVQSSGESCLHDICYDDCNGSAYVDTPGCRACRLAESIWGNCEAEPTTSLRKVGSHNRIKTPIDPDKPTLLSWFAQNTNTKDDVDNCRDTTCGAGFVASRDDLTGAIMCISSENVCDDNYTCSQGAKINISAGGVGCNCCSSAKIDSGGNCCTSGESINGVCVPNTSSKRVATFQIFGTGTYYPAGTYALYCSGTMEDDANTPKCNNGRYFVVQTASPKQYMDPQYNGGSPTQYVKMFYTKDEGETTCTYNPNDKSWNDGCASPQHYMVSFTQ